MTRERVWVGSYTPDSEPAGIGAGIYQVWFDTGTGQLGSDGLAAATCGPSFLAAHPTGNHLYAVNEHTDGTVTAFAVQPQGELTELSQVSTGASVPCHLTVPPGARELVVSHYADGVVTVLPLTSDGCPAPPAAHLTHVGHGPIAERQQGPHAHCARLAPDGRHLLVADLGTDELRCYVPDPVTHRMQRTMPIPLPPGSGPRHLVSAANGQVYVVGELDATLHLLRWPTGGYDGHAGFDSQHIVPEVTVSAVGDDQPVSYPAELALSRCGRRLYVANRGADCVSTFAVDGPVPQHLADVSTGGSWPRHFALAGDLGEYLLVANQFSHTLTVLWCDPDTGIPADTGQRLEVPSPAMVLSHGR